ncbi:PREDICTED: putative uncharacterized protein DDB_G0290521 [Camelina sativa]|uniref:Uncharacterized protein n=1 Tax=Camelina sativa TaxID=90675 RepID=A0ABM0TP41_CAMSA|nr:PREDICTED: putative uncharacterized protein DDB_G0290521 [Camelina sativa]
MSILIIHHYLVRDFFAVPFLTPHGFGYHHFCRDSFLHVPQRPIPLLGLKKKRSQRAYFKPSNTRKPQSYNPDPVQAPPPDPVQAPTQEGAQSYNPDPVQAPTPDPVQAPTQEGAQSYNPDPVPAPTQEGDFFDGSVTLCAAPSPRHVPIPIFCGREMTKVSSKLTPRLEE